MERLCMTPHQKSLKVNWLQFFWSDNFTLMEVYANIMKRLVIAKVRSLSLSPKSNLTLHKSKSISSTENFIFFGYVDLILLYTYLSLHVCSETYLHISALSIHIRVQMNKCDIDRTSYTADIWLHGNIPMVSIVLLFFSPVWVINEITQHKSVYLHRCHQLKLYLINV